MCEPVSVILVEDDPDFVYLIRQMLEQDKRLSFCGCAGNRADGVALAKRVRPQIVLMDLNLSGSELDGVEAAKEIALSTTAKVLLLTSFEQPEIIIQASKKSFASGYIFKSQYQLLPGVIHRAATAHTAQEQMIKELILQDLSPAERSVLRGLLGEELSLLSSDKTIANQKTKIFKKLGLKSTNELFRVFSRYQAG